MECPRRWAVLYSILFILIQTANVQCHIDQHEDRSTQHQANWKRDVPNPLPKTLNVISQSPSCYPLDQLLFNQPAISNVPNVVLTPQCSILPESLSCNGVPRIPFENYANMVQAVPAVWQISQPANDMFNYPPATLQISPSCAVPANQPGTVESSEPTGETDTQDPVPQNDGCDDGLPLNLQINIPSQNIPAPRITIVSTAPTPVTPTNSESFLPIPQFLPPPLPIVVKKSRSSLRNVLPILLIALLSDQGCCNNGCCCPCNCNCNSDSPIPIPYPIPIPVNNPIINNDRSSYSSPKRGQRDNEDDNDDN